MGTATFERLPTAARRALAAWLGEALPALGDGVEGVVLYGGVALGDFAPRWSDLDLCVVLRGPPGVERIAALDARHRALFRRFVEEGEGGWASPQFVEGGIVPAALLAAPEAEGEGAGVHAGRVQHLARTGLEPFDRRLLAEAAIPLVGRLGPVALPSDVALARQLRRDLDRLELARHPPALRAAGLLHDAARALCFWEDGDLLSKGAALRRRVARDDGLAEAFALAARCREEGAAWTLERAEAVGGHFEDARPRVLARLSRFA